MIQQLDAGQPGFRFTRTQHFLDMDPPHVLLICQVHAWWVSFFDTLDTTEYNKNHYKIISPVLSKIDLVHDTFAAKDSNFFLRISFLVIENSESSDVDDDTVWRRQLY